jgi:hypothetical protein
VVRFKTVSKISIANLPAGRPRVTECVRTRHAESLLEGGWRHGCDEHAMDAADQLLQSCH